MHVVIVGAGAVGSHVARMLSAEGHEVAVAELEEERARHLDATLDALVVQGSGVDPDVLRRLEIERADLLLAVTAVDEVNLIACMTGRRHGPPRLRAVARVRQSRYGAGEGGLSAGDLGLDALISPERAIAGAVLDVLRYPGSGEMRELAAGELVLVGMSLGADSPLIHDALADLRREFVGDFVVMAVEGPRGVRIPSGADRMSLDERVYLLTRPAHLEEVAILSGSPWHRPQRILVVGCGDTGLAVAEDLEREGRAVTVLEKSPERAEVVASRLDRSLVLLGDACSPETLRGCIEEGRIDAAAVLLAEPEKSLLVGLLARSLGARKVVVRCDEDGYFGLAARLGVDGVLSPKRAMSDEILAYVRRGAVGPVQVIGDHEAEIVRLRVAGGAEGTGLRSTPLRQLALPEETLIGAIIRGRDVMLASGSSVLQAGDELLVVGRPAALEELGRRLSG